MAWHKSAYTRKTDPLHPEDAGADGDTHSLSDEELTKQAKSGDSAAFGELIRRHRTKAYRLARSIAQDEFLAEDILQEAFWLIGKKCRLSEANFPRHRLPPRNITRKLLMHLSA